MVRFNLLQAQIKLRQNEIAGEDDLNPRQTEVGRRWFLSNYGYGTSVNKQHCLVRYVYNGKKFQEN